ncbi:dynein heavy chain 1, axonemal isoform X2 [Kryptolebias marmoratus]|uniref:dynein heavy chain 1, axonemal isoform X2 n=1 Tax=Kryptolebias marmoratus TaxID=37003 RepID=UPI0018ACA7A2|nr:dynein heavy chain 1, axonemal isoform X2 [Kryptolebias marmoratus]
MDKNPLGVPMPRRPSGKPTEHSSSVRRRNKVTCTEKQTLFCSDILSTFNVPRSQGQSSLTSGHLNSPEGATIKASLVRCEDLPQTSQQPLASYFSSRGEMPKVQTSYDDFRPGQIPRKLLIERIRREYLKLDLEELLSEKGIDCNLLVPKQVTTPDYLVPPYFSLELFDNEDYDCRTPEDWLALGIDEGSPVRKPIPAKALLSKDDETQSEDSRSLEYSWHLVGVLDYSKEKCEYLVQKVHQDTRRSDGEGNPKRNEKRTKKMSYLRGGTKHWVPRIRLLFNAEDPHVFVERIDFALRLRNDIETRLLHSVSVDNMPIWQGTPSLSNDSLQRIEKLALAFPPGLDQKILEEHVSDLKKEVKREYDRIMNGMIFDKVVASNPKKFPHITLPQKEPQYVPQNGKTIINLPFMCAFWSRSKCGLNYYFQKSIYFYFIFFSLTFPGFVAVPHYNYTEYRAVFSSKFLLLKPKVFSVLSEVLFESRKIANMRLFNVTMIKSLRLDEFEVVQSQVHSQMALYLQQDWVDTLSNIIRSTLSSLNKSLFNVNESSFNVYRFSKLHSLMKVIHLSMQDSLRYLVQRSLVSLSELLLETCRSVLTCPQDLVWGNDLITSPYKPQKMPIFLVDLVLDQAGVYYSTPLEDFETSVLKLFNNAILATGCVPQLEKTVMKNLVFHVDLLLNSVTLLEPEASELRQKVQNCLIQAAIPLRAYATEYEKHLDLYNLEIETFLKSHGAELKSQEVKKEVEHHLKEKEKLEQSLPSSIVIGPFFVRVEPVRQSLTKKRKALASALLEQFALRLRNQIENACEKFGFISRKLSEKPNSIEELAEKRKWMKQIPEQLKSYKELLGKTLPDYEVLEECRHCLSVEDVNKKWTAIWWPQMVINQMEAVEIEHEQDEERFHKIQITDNSNFEEQLITLQNLIAAFAGYSDIELASEMANKVRRIKKQLKQCQTMAQIYTTREQLLGLPVTNYDHLHKMVNDFQRFKEFWTTTSDWLNWNESWLSDPLSSIDPEQLQLIMTKAKETMNECVKQFEDLPDIQRVAIIMQSKIEDFHPLFLVIQCLRSPRMKIRHWEMVSERINIKVRPKANSNLTRYLELGLQNHTDEIASVAEMAQKEYSIEQALEKMDKEWSTVVFDLLPYKDTGTYILKWPDEAFQLLDDHIVIIQNLSLSPFKTFFESHINTWERKLRMTQDLLEEWFVCQRGWLNLEPIFSSDDVNQQLPAEGHLFKQLKQHLKSVMRRVVPNTKVIELCQNPNLLCILLKCKMFLEKIYKCLNKCLEEKRVSFPRFFFLSDVELLELLSVTKDPSAVQPYLHKCFANITELQFQSDLQITHMCSGDGEEVKLFPPVWPTGNVEGWLTDLEKSMKATLRDNIDRSLQGYSEQAHVEWVLSWPGQVGIGGSQVFWTADVSKALEQGDLASHLYPKLQTQLGDIVQRMKGQLSRTQQAALSSLIVIEAHAKDVVAKLVEQNVSSIDDFEWITQLRYYWNDEDLCICALNAELLYGYEYLGNSGRLVITPLTNRCYLTLTGGLNLKFGGALAGPSGTGKTETIKDLGKALGMHTLVFNCSDRLDPIIVGRFLKGLASSGAWACFDDIVQVDVEVLSVMAQQISSIQKAQQQQAVHFVFEGAEIPLNPSCAVFVTMSPDFTRCVKMPDNLKTLFRPVAMMAPDSAMIAEVSLYSLGFSDAKVLSKKIVAVFRLSSEQLSFQDHYDFSIRAVKTVISVAGNLRREHPNLGQELICLRAIHEACVPRILQDDLKLFSDIVSDLFPNTKLEPASDGLLEKSLRIISNTKNLKDVEGFINKCIQLYETTVIRHGLMLVGPPGSGKTKCYEVLGAAITALEGQPSVRGGVYEAVQIYVLNPKSITVRQLYGEYDSQTHQWTEGVFSALIREGTTAVDKKKRWYMFDGPVDPVWIDGMNTVLDDNKKLCLPSGEVIKLTDEMTVMFEVQDLAMATPATVNRGGMVYFEPSVLELTALTECWLNQVPEVLKPFTEQLSSLFSRFLQNSIKFVRSSVKEVIPSLDSNLTCSLLKLMECFVCSYTIKEAELLPHQKELDHLKELIEPWFFFSLVWSVGATGDAASRQHFSSWLKSKMAEEQVKLCFPEDGLVYDYRLDDAGISNMENDKEDERQVQWVSWMKNTERVTIPPETSFTDIFVPTADTVRMSFLMDLLLTNKKPVLCVGPSGAGKTRTISDKLLRNMPAEYVTHVLMFSACTSANQAQDYIESKLNKRRKGVLAPPLGKHFVFFIDDLHMPVLESCGAQPSIELLRQWMDHSGWYDRKQTGTFNHLVDMNFACAMGTPGGVKSPITQRFTRHFNILSFVDMEDANKRTIFSTILGSLMELVPALQPLKESLVDATIQIYNAVTSHLLPTPAKCHYTFNLKDLSKVFQGMLMAEVYMMKDKSELLRLWYHESCRVFQDSLVCAEDRDWFNGLLKDRIQEFDCCFEDVVPSHPVLYGDFTGPEPDLKIYGYIEDKENLVNLMKKYMDEYNQSSRTKMELVLFMDAIEHVCRISRILRQPLGNALLLGVRGSGRQSLTKLASYMAGYKCFQIELSKNYGQIEWRKDIKSVLLSAGLQNQKITFLFVETQIKSESFLEDINHILMSGGVPNLYSADEQEQIFAAMRPVVQYEGQQPTETNLTAAYVRRVRSNLHIVLCMSPTGETLRSRLRRFPSLVTCCTVDWFSVWSEEALRAVATSFLTELSELAASPSAMEALTLTCVKIHQTVAKRSERFQAELSRHNSVTPKSYKELLKAFSDLIGRKKQELCTSSQRLTTALNKLFSTAEEVSKMREEQERMRPYLERIVKDVEETTKTIESNTVVTEEINASIQEMEAKASEKECFARTIATNAQKDISNALKTLNTALTRLNSLNINSITEVQAMQQPPHEVKLVLEALCFMKGIEPAKIPGEKPGTSFDDYLEPAKGLLQDPNSFLESLNKYDKDNIPDDVISSVQPYIDNEEFQPTSIAKVSTVCSSICQWVRAMHSYYFVVKAVNPKQQALQEAQEDLKANQQMLDEAKKTLVEVESNTATLQTKLRGCLAKKEKLDSKHQWLEARLVRANRLIDGMAEEKVCWTETVQHLDSRVNNLAGDVLLSAGYVAYLGPFTESYRASIAEKWLKCLKELNVPHSDEPNLINTLGDPIKIHCWQISGLPKDGLSVENSVIAQSSVRWPLFIDPQGQANKWIKNMERDNGLEVVRPSDEDCLHRLESAILFGKPVLLENVGEELDPALQPVLFQQTFQQQDKTSPMLRDAVIPYHEGFKMYITTKLPNPHYSPEVYENVTVINFTLSKSSLEDHLLSQAVAEEHPDLEEAKNQLITSSAKRKQELKGTEDEIVSRLSSEKGNLLDTEDQIPGLEALKIRAGEIKAKVIEAEKTEQDIDAARLEYAPVAVHARILFLCVSELSNIDPTYQYSLEWFLGIFMAAVANSDTADTIEKRIANIKEFFTFSLYSSVCRSLFEKHKLMFAFLLCARVMMNENKVDMAEWGYLLSGAVPVRELANPGVSWVSERTWQDVLGLSTLDVFDNLAESFTKHLQGFKTILDSKHPHREPLPGEWDTRLNSFQKLLLLRCLRPDCLIQGLQDFVSSQLGQRYIQPRISDLSVIFKESSPISPIIFVLSPGADPAADIHKFADAMQFSKKMITISLGRGQGPSAEAVMRTAVERGQWVLFQNCHLAPSWMPTLERLIERVDPVKVHKDFRLWLTTLPSNEFPVSILQSGTRITSEPPSGIRAHLQRTYLRVTNESICSSAEMARFKSLLLSLCLFHGVVLERRRFGPVGFNVPYGFTDDDLNICISHMKMILDEYRDIPYKILKYSVGEINYGGHVTDDWDRRCLLSMLEDFCCPAVLSADHVYSSSGVYQQIDPNLDIKGYLAYVQDLPINDAAEIFGFHDNANIRFGQNEAFTLLDAVVCLQPRLSCSSAQGKPFEETVEEIVVDMKEKIPQPFVVQEVIEKYPILYDESMNAALIHEVIRYNKLLEVISQSLGDVMKALKSSEGMSSKLESMAQSLFNNMVPDLWEAKAYPSLKPLGSWVSDLLQRISFLQRWISSGPPPVFWISGFFSPQAFLTGTLQNYARRSGYSVDRVGFDFEVITKSVSEITVTPRTGCYIHGLFLEGARWDSEAGLLTESKPKELYTQMAVIWLVPKHNRTPPASRVYLCPVYETLRRAGTWTSTGRSTDYVTAVELPTDRSESHWIKRGVALICALDF